ncbi:MAG: hypothetical protein QM621_13570, partial [Aeromicrobium sp.]|uniref:2-oxoglutarate dehydrogenase E1 subunit family protein n=1 Tax=Aeromicrobium sp. TaxID=1871063 RepID=UPI0039E2D8D2
MAESPTASNSPSQAPDFGTNQWLVEEMYDRYTADPSSVDATWADFFARRGAPQGGGNGVAAAAPAPEAAAPTP